MRRTDRAAVRRPGLRRPDHRFDRVWGARLAEVARALGQPSPSSEAIAARDLGAAVLPFLGDGDRSRVWLVLSVLCGAMPTDRELIEVCRDLEFDAGARLVEHVLRHTTEASSTRRVRVVSGATVVDVSATLRMPFTTGIQRVVRESASRWVAGDRSIPVSWTPDFQAIRELTPAERTLLDERLPAEREDIPPERPGTAVLVPWQSTYLTGEVLAEIDRAERVRTLAQYARCRTGFIVYDLIPVSAPETLRTWEEDSFAHHLTALRESDRLVAISRSSADEYRGWRSMLAAVGRPGPTITSATLPATVPPSDENTLALARQRFVVGGLPLVLVVGSAEPRKNHLPILHAAEVLWRRGLRFSLTFIGGRSWGGTEFDATLAALQAAERPIERATGITDEFMYAAYRLARFTMFPSLTEGYGLPVAESLAVGTPVITSGFGSMAEIADRGALLVDPRDDESILSAMEALLTDDGLLQRLRDEAKGRPTSSWQDYAERCWSLLTDPDSPGDDVA